MARPDGFSKLDRAARVAWVSAAAARGAPEALAAELDSFLHPDAEVQRLLEMLSENTLSNFPLPYGIVPGLLVNGVNRLVPMVTEESSVVAAASKAARFWRTRGGVSAEVLGTEKVGQVHFQWSGEPARLERFFAAEAAGLRAAVAPITASMEARGGGLRGLALLPLGPEEPRLFQLRVRFETCDAMGANFINSALDALALALVQAARASPLLAEDEREIDVLMCILSNYTPGALTRAWVQCPVEALGDFPMFNLDAAAFAARFRAAVRVAELDPFRATTHNKGVMNGVDALAVATGNDFRAIEAACHAYAARSGQVRSLSHAAVEDGQFRFELALPLAVGTVGGLTDLHPLGRRSLQLLGAPDARTLMEIFAAVGLIQNFAAIMALITQGTRGHMRLHLSNMLSRCEASPEETAAAMAHFAAIPFSLSAVQAFLAARRGA